MRQKLRADLYREWFTGASVSLDKAPRTDRCKQRYRTAFQLFNGGFTGTARSFHQPVYRHRRAGNDLATFPTRRTGLFRTIHQPEIRPDDAEIDWIKTFSIYFYTNQKGKKIHSPLFPTYIF